MKIFWIIFILALLFVIGSASALRYFGNPKPADKPETKPELPPHDKES